MLNFSARLTEHCTRSKSARPGDRELFFSRPKLNVSRLRRPGAVRAQPCLASGNISVLSLGGTIQVISSLILGKCSLLSLEVPKELTSKTREVPKENLETLAKSKCAAAVVTKTRNDLQ